MEFKVKLTGDAHVATRYPVVEVKIHMPAISLNWIPSNMKKISLDIQKVPPNRSQVRNVRNSLLTVATIKDSVVENEHANPNHIIRETVLLLSQSVTTLNNTKTFASPSDMMADTAVMVKRNWQLWRNEMNISVNQMSMQDVTNSPRL